jgi:hypothetical protein
MTYGCKDKPLTQPITEVQDGWYASGPRRKVEVPFRMSTDCNYQTTELGKSDKGCTDCTRRSDDK